MRSFYSHLAAVQTEIEQVSTLRKPIFRSSAIFPVLRNEYCSSQILFMGYWLLKRNITEIGLLYTLRNEAGKTISRNYLPIKSAKAFCIDLNDFPQIAHEQAFCGSLELEVFSTRDLVFPYPAFVLNYYGANFSTAVHTVGRIYNDLEDLQVNEEYKVSEAGFDIYGKKEYQPFVAFTNGTMPNSSPIIRYKVTNQYGETFEGNINLPPLQTYQTYFLQLKDFLPLEEWLKNEIGSIAIGHNFEGFFPRFLVGNFEKNGQAISITHSYYDSSPLNDAKSYWTRQDERFHDSSVQIPLYIGEGYFTKIALYPIFSPSDFDISFIFYDKTGNKIAELPHEININSANGKYDLIDIGDLIEKHRLDASKIVSTNMICTWQNKQAIPTRIKFGLNVGKQGNSFALPSNICFAPILGNPSILNKKTSFRWAPFLNIGDSEVVITNGATLKEYDRIAEIRTIFHREIDEKTIERSYTLPPNASETIRVAADPILKEFFDGRSGWVSVTSDNPFVNGWYFDFHQSGVVAADHVF